MSATNATSNYNLPLFIGTDKPAWLVDWNGAMNAIDTAIASVSAAAGGTASDLSALTLSVNGLSETVSAHTTSITTLTTAVSGNTGSINTINSLIGNGEPTTTDKTIIGAINELHAEIGGGGSVVASAVSYDNTSSQLTATNVQAAIDEVKNLIPSTPAATSEVKTGVLAAGQTSLTLTFTSQTIGAATLVDIYTGTFGVNPTDVVITGQAVALTFDAQQASVNVAVKVQN